MGLAVDPRAPHVPKLAQSIKTWAEKRAELERGEVDRAAYADERPLSDISPGALMFSCEQPPIPRGLFHYSRMKSAPRKPRSGNNCMPEYGRVRGVIRRHSGLSKLRKTIFAFLYSRLLTWANAIDEGLNPPRSFNSVSPARNRPSGDPNCELFPQGLIIPVPPSTPLYRPVGIDGNNWVVFPGRDAKRKPSNQRVRGLLFPLFRWWLCPAAMPKQYQAVFGSTKTRVQKPVPTIPTRWQRFCRFVIPVAPSFRCRDGTRAAE